MKKRILLPDEERITAWYNVMPDIPNGILPPLNPANNEPLTPDLMAPIFPMGLLEQEMSADRYIDIPEEVLDIWAIWRPSPLIRANFLEKKLGTKARIYYKYEGVSPSGSHKTNSSDRKSTRLNSSHTDISRTPSSA